MITIKYGGGIYACERRKGGRVGVAARPGRVTHAKIVDSEELAISWLCDHGLKKSKAKQLVCPTSAQS